MGLAVLLTAGRGITASPVAATAPSTAGAGAVGDTLDDATHAASASTGNNNATRMALVDRTVSISVTYKLR